MLPSSNASDPVLTIAIPTWNRSPYLQLNLVQLRKEMATLPHGLIELIISDNASEDATQSVIATAVSGGLSVSNVRNSANIGSDANIAQCFNLARGRYVLILGDDDLLVDGALASLVSLLEHNDFGVVCLRTFGYDEDFRAEYPRITDPDRTFQNAGDFLVAAGPLTVLISSCVINKQALPHVDATQFCGGNLVQVHLVFEAALSRSHNLMTGKYCVAYKRNNWGYYDFSKVFVVELGKIVDKYVALGLNRVSAHRLESRMLLGFFPFYILKQRLQKSGDLALTQQRFMERFSGKPLFVWWVYPILMLPRPLAVAWGAFATVVGRTLNGDFRRGLWFLGSAVRRLMQRK